MKANNYSKAVTGTSSIFIANTFTSGAVQVQHGLGRVPRQIILSNSEPPIGGYPGTNIFLASKDANMFVVQGNNIGGYAAGIVVDFDWMAVV